MPTSPTPHCGYPIAISYFEDMLNLMRMAFAPQELSKLSTALPILLLWGEQDPCTAFGKSSTRLMNLLREQGHTQLTAHHYPQLRHEILHEDTRQTVFDDILSSIQHTCLNTVQP